MKIKLVLIALAVVLFAFAPSDPPEPQAYLPVVIKNPSTEVTVTLCPNLHIDEFISPMDPAAIFAHYVEISYWPTGECVDAVEVYNAETGENIWPGYIYWGHGYGFNYDEFGHIIDWYPKKVGIAFPTGETLAEPTEYKMKFVLHFRNGCTTSVSGKFLAAPVNWYFPRYPMAECPRDYP
jgi:hypothetical protein